MTDTMIQVMGWILISTIWVFVLVGGRRTIREIRTHLQSRSPPVRRHLSQGWSAS
ncbi:MAG: hypothetical protein O2910_08910 [Proteobacteria bacterium]|nr:hypothetical protein [Pseudomonadota bacterium]